MESRKSKVVIPAERDLPEQQAEPTIVRLATSHACLSLLSVATGSQALVIYVSVHDAVVRLGPRWSVDSRKY